VGSAPGEGGGVGVFFGGGLGGAGGGGGWGAGGGRGGAGGGGGGCACGSDFLDSPDPEAARLVLELRARDRLAAWRGCYLLTTCWLLAAGTASQEPGGKHSADQTQKSGSAPTPKHLGANIYIVANHIAEMA
jgi:hypothetical protein